MNTTLDDLHDAVLVRIEIEWEAAIVRLHIRHQKGPRVITVEGVTFVGIPHTDPWGPSESIMEGDVFDEPPGVRVFIQMQSGDELTFKGTKVTSAG